jgi:hypothetical protein
MAHLGINNSTRFAALGCQRGHSYQMVRRHLPIGPVFVRGRMREEHPRHPHSLSFADLCWYIQEQAFGGLDADTAKVLEGLARSAKPGADAPRRLKPGIPSS